MWVSLWVVFFIINGVDKEVAVAGRLTLKAGFTFTMIL